MLLSLPRTNHLPRSDGTARASLSPRYRPFHPAAIDKVIHVGTAPGAGERIGHVTQRQPQRDGFVVVDIHLQLRHLRQVVSAHRLQFAALVGRRQQLAAQLHQAVAVGTAAGHQLEGEAVALPETVYRRRGHGEEGGVADRPQLFGGAQGDGLGGVVVPFALRPVFSDTKAIPAFCPLPLKLKPSTVKMTSVLAFFGEEPVGDLAAHLGGTHRGGPGGQGVLDHDLTLVLHRQEAARQLPHRQRHRPANQRVSAHHHCAPAQAAEHPALVARLRTSPQAVKGAEEPFVCGLEWLSSAPHSAGVRVSATTTDSIIAEIMVTENWR